MSLTIRRLGAEEAKRREGLRSAEAQAQAEGKGIWAEGTENVSKGWAMKRSLDGR